MKRALIIIMTIAVAAGAVTAQACTSAIVSAARSATGRPLLWKHRDTGAAGNFLERVERPGEIGYVALFNDGDSLLREAWMGMNDAGFAIMNTASYNLAPDTARLKDCEGLVMALALSRCASISDFECMLDTMPKPLGVQANFGAIDALGHGAYYETDDYGYVKYDLADAADGLLVRTNYSVSGDADGGSGYIRYDNACRLIGDAKVSPQTLIDGLSRSFYHSLLGRDVLADTCRYAVDQDFIPRRISTASIVVEGVTPGADVSAMTMWAALGYPPVAIVRKVGLRDLPAEVRPVAGLWQAPDCIDAGRRRSRVFGIKRGSGSHYIDMDYLREIIPQMRRRSSVIFTNPEMLE